MSNPFDALGVNVTASVRMPILHPGTGEVLVDENNREAYLELLSEDSDAGQRFDRDVSKQTIKKIRARGLKAVDDADQLEIQVDRISALITGWHLVGLDGRAIDFPFSQENAKRLMAEKSMAWLRRRAIAFVADAGNFMRASSTS